MADRPTLILDVMGADLGIGEMLAGAAQACAARTNGPFDLVIVTAEEDKTRQLADEILGPAADKASVSWRLELAEDKLPCEFTNPMDIYRRYPKSSIRVAMNVAKDIPASAVISPGTTGLVMAAAMFTLGRVKGIERPPIGTPMPTKGKQLFWVDGGSNVDCKAKHLYQFAVLAHWYIKKVQHIDNPSIALLSNGSEEYKGNTVIREAHALLKADKDLNYSGFTEGHSMFNGDLDIMVVDGFLGNILLKFAEGIMETLMTLGKQEFKSSPVAMLAAGLLQKGPWKRIRKRVDYTSFGGAPLLGLNGNVIISHGRSPALAINNALMVGQEMVNANIAGEVANYLAHHSATTENGNVSQSERNA